ncbi:hypothetical protein BESB_038490 [Besnoitia besnoiti]|uniref:Transmembrane protein n=1 Tax=Besnoitia besnoiti TaxID=94643 RepID=A0A2A9MLZ8_BESBE|nr:hypothetical protein BESB_038490 [Besnoitia besnoiti]PFH37391.1 hypothetical protein BESB_038490 [Besnoitia besnoiti]
MFLFIEPLRQAAIGNRSRRFEAVASAACRFPLKMKAIYCLFLLAAALGCDAEQQPLKSDPAWPSLRAVVHLRGPSEASDSRHDEANESYFEEGKSRDQAVDQDSHLEQQNTSSADQEARHFSALQVNQKATTSELQSGAVPQPEQCSCEFAGSCLPKGSCLAVAFTLVLATIVFIIVLAWLLQWIIAIPSEWILAKHLPKHRRPTAAGAQPAKGDETEARGLLADDEAAKRGNQSAPSDEEQEEMERARRAGPSGVPPPSPTESGRL